MNFRDLKAFLVVSRTGNITRAAEQLHMSQPALSRRIAELEDEVAAPLFDRTGRRLTLTDRGMRFEAHAREMLEAYERMQRDMAEAPEALTGMLERQLEAKVVFEYATLEDLAKAHGVPLDELKKTVEEVNRSIETGKDPWRPVVDPKMKLHTEGPWYVSRLSPKMHHTMGGLYTTPRAEVVNVDGKVIPGLYAAGEATGGVHGAVRLGSNATTDCIVNGRIAGMEVAKR